MTEVELDIRPNRISVKLDIYDWLSSGIVTVKALIQVDCSLLESD